MLRYCWVDVIGDEPTLPTLDQLLVLDGLSCILRKIIISQSWKKTCKNGAYFDISPKACIDD